MFFGKKRTRSTEELWRGRDLSAYVKIAEITSGKAICQVRDS